MTSGSHGVDVGLSLVAEMGCLGWLSCFLSNLGDQSCKFDKYIYLQKQ